MLKIRILFKGSAKGPLHVKGRQLGNGGACHLTGVYHDIGDLKTNSIKILRPRQNGRRFADDTFKRIFVSEISLKFPKGPINDIPALIQVMTLGADQATSHYLNKRWLDYRRIYA